uniref:Uncharacterized protein n=1 Tax=Arundo donax TaxID=35708 RepID=A0A0A9HXN0_ARUDO
METPRAMRTVSAASAPS